MKKHGRPRGLRKTGGRKKGVLNKATVARELALLCTSEAIEALRAVCADSSADKTARVQAACKLLDLLPAQLLRTKGALPAQDVIDVLLRNADKDHLQCNSHPVAVDGVL